MLPEQVEKLRQEYTGKVVAVETDRPEMVCWVGAHGRVKTITMNGRALVEFDGADHAWHEVELDYLKVVDTPEPKAEGAPSEPVAAEAAPTGQPSPRSDSDTAEKLSRLEIARLEKEAEEASKKPADEAIGETSESG